MNHSMRSTGTDAQPACDQGEGCHEGQRCVETPLTRHECAVVGCYFDDDSCLGDRRTTSSPMVRPLNASWCVASPGWTVPVRHIAHLPNTATHLPNLATLALIWITWAM